MSDSITRTKRVLPCVGVFFTALMLGCPAEPPPEDNQYDNIMTFDTASVRIAKERDTLTLRVELAISDEQKVMGLMERRSLAENAGMLFIYNSMQPGEAGFWMYRTRIPLDIAYLDSAGVIRAVKAMMPCPTTIARGCPTYDPGVPYQYALEVNAGFFARHGVAVGHSVLLNGVSAAVRSRAPTKKA